MYLTCYSGYAESIDEPGDIETRLREIAPFVLHKHADPKSLMSR